MTKTLTAALAGLALLGFAGSAMADCSVLHSAQISTPVDSAQTTVPQSPKPADSDS